VVRGVTKSLFPNTTGAESTDVNGLQSFDSDGFTIGSGSGSGVWGGNSGATYVAWNWKSGGTAVSNTDGSVTSQVSANVDAGFSVATFTTPATGTGFTVGHGLGVKPSMLITRQRGSGSAWWVWHKDFPSPNTNYLYLHEAFSIGSLTQSTNSWDNTQPTTSVWSQRSDWAFQTNQPAVCYAFADVEGYLKAGSFIGNGSTDGPFVYTGFRPAFVLAKSDVNGSYWVMHDSKRDTYNVSDKYVWANLSDAEGSLYSKFDFLSNGFKCRNANDNVNYSGTAVYYIAFAENPFKYATAR